MLKAINSGIVFLMELTMLYACAIYGYSKGATIITKYAYAGFLVLICITLWGIYAAPRSARRLPAPYVFIFRASMFLIASFFLYQLHYRNAAFVMSTLAILTQSIDYFTE